MGQEELKKIIESIIEETFDELKKTYSNCCKNTSKNIKGGVIFPSYSNNNNNNIRVSEQELRCMFIQKFYENKLYEKGLCYSIETPTIEKYRFTYTDNDGTKNRNKPKVDNDGESARIDLTIHDKEDIDKRLCIIEFKAHGRTKDHDYTKDLLKLYSELPDCESEQPDCELLRYFVQIFESFNKRTFKSVNKKLNKASDDIIKNDTQNNYKSDKRIFEKVHCRFDILNDKYYKDDKNDIDNRDSLNKKLIEKLIGDANNNP